MKIFALHYIAVAFLILLVITILLIIVAIITRLHHSHVESYINRKTEEFYPLIFDYLDKRVKKSILIQFVGNKNKDWDIFEDLVFELMSDLEGQERETLINLLRIPTLMNRHTKNIQTRKKKKIIKACRYFEHIQFVNNKLVSRLVDLGSHGSPILSVASASAMMGSEKIEIQAQAVLMLVRRNNVSAMTILDILYKFHRASESEDPNIEGRYLEQIIEDGGITHKNIAVLIKGLADLNYIDQAPFIHEFFIRHTEYHNNSTIVEAVIYAFGQFYYLDALDIIRFYLDDEDPSVRKTSLRALAMFELPEDKDRIKKYLEDSDIFVRLAAVKALESFGKQSIRELKEYGSIENIRINFRERSIQN